MSREGSSSGRRKAMMKSESTLNLLESIKSFLTRSKEKPYRPNQSQNVDPALISFARLGLLAYYTNPL